MAKVTSSTCSYSSACVNPGPRTRLNGSAQEFCAPHLREVRSAMTSAPTSNHIDRETARDRRGGAGWMAGLDVRSYRRLG